MIDERLVGVWRVLENNDDDDGDDEEGDDDNADDDGD